MTIATKTFPSKKPAKYTRDFREGLRDGDLLFCAGTAWTSRMIRAATGSVWSHVAFVMRLPSIDRVMVLESVESQGVRAVPLSKYLSDYDNNSNAYPGGVAVARHSAIQEALIESPIQKKFGKFSVDQFGADYDKAEIAKITARIVAGFLPFSKKERIELDRDRQYICSEYVWECYHRIGIDIEYDKRGFVAPHDFATDPRTQLLEVLQDANGKPA